MRDWLHNVVEHETRFELASASSSNILCVSANTYETVRSLLSVSPPERPGSTQPPVNPC